ncbi:MAG: hypothetical protein JKY43_05410 [Phycisphaerales bacterium]|nr:hypothetical protein [Phycisphaerales bacterium]
MATETYFFKIDSNGRTPVQIKNKIAQIDALLDSLFTTALTSVGNGNIVQYKLDTGQTKTDVTYSSTSSVTDAIEKYENLRQRYVNMLSPRVVKMMDSRNFRRR